MTKFVIAGKSDCVYFAKAELVADTLERSLPSFKVHKVLKSPSEWDSWLRETCEKNKWSHSKSPIVWRECLDRGGKGMLIGDANDFQEYAKGYYGVYSHLKSVDLERISKENDNDFKLRRREFEQEQALIQPFNVCISHPSNKVAYLIMPDLLNGQIFGANIDVFIRLYEQNTDLDMSCIKMEIEDLASESLRNVTCTNNAQEAFEKADLVILFDELIEKEEPTVEIKDPIIAEYHNPYVSLAKHIDLYANQNCRVFITPFESHSRIFGLVWSFISELKRLNGRTQVIGNSMCDELVAKSVLSKRLKMSQANVRDVVVIGQSIHESHYIDIAQARITGYEGAVWAAENTNWQSLVEMIADADWMQKDFPVLVTQRENFIKQRANRSNLLSFAQSICLTLRLWMNRTQSDNSLHSAIVLATGSHSITSDLCLSLPIVFKNGEFNLNSHFVTNNQVNKIIAEIVKETEQYISDRFIEDIYLLMKTPRNTPQIENQQTQSQPKDDQNPIEVENEEEPAAKNKAELHVDFQEPTVHEIDMNYGEAKNGNEDEEVEAEVAVAEDEEN